MKIAIGTDHRGFKIKDAICKQLDSYHIIDMGCFDKQRCDYPVFAKLVASAVASGDADLGILLCGSGIGMAIAANRYKNIYAGLCWSPEVAKAAREDDNINILVLPADFISLEQAAFIVDTWLHAEFKKGRYQIRLEMIDE